MNSSESVTELPLEGTSAIGTKTDRHTPQMVHAGENAALAGVAACSAIFLAISCQMLLADSAGALDTVARTARRKV